MAEAPISLIPNFKELIIYLAEACTRLASDPYSVASIPAKFSEKDAKICRSILSMFANLFRDNPDTCELYVKYFQRYFTDIAIFGVYTQSESDDVLEDIVSKKFERATLLSKRYRWRRQENPFKLLPMTKGATPFHAAVIDSLLCTSTFLVGLRTDMFEFDEEEEMEDIDRLTERILFVLFKVLVRFRVPEWLETISEPFGKGGQIKLLRETEDMRVRIFREESDEMESDFEDCCSDNDDYWRYY